MWQQNLHMEKTLVGFKDHKLSHVTRLQTSGPEFTSVQSRMGSSADNDADACGPCTSILSHSCSSHPGLEAQTWTTCGGVLVSLTTDLLEKLFTASVQQL